MLERDPSNRATLEELLATSWVTNNFTESIRLQDVTVYRHGFGNIDKLIKSKITARKTVNIDDIMPKTLTKMNSKEEE